MDKKTKLMAICAAGAAAILIGAGLARCAIAPSEPETVVPAEEQGQQIEQADDSFSGYAGTTWESEDGTCTLALSDSTIIESGEAGVQVMYYEVISEEPDDFGISAQISFTRSAGEAASQTLLSISDAGGWKSISCDAFALSKSYLIAEGSEAGLELSAHSPELNELLDAEDSEIASAIAQKASAASPTATLATWDGEVYIDCNEDVLTTSFHLNDAASTIVQLSLDRGSGELSAL